MKNWGWIKWVVIAVVILYVWKFVQNQLASQNAPQLGNDEYYPGWAYAAPLRFGPPRTWYRPPTAPPSPYRYGPRYPRGISAQRG